MKLEQTLEMPNLCQEESRGYFVVRDLECLSASALYSPKLEASITKKLAIAQKPTPHLLSIYPFGKSQLHIHEGPGGTAHVKTGEGEKQSISSYQAAMVATQFQAEKQQWQDFSIKEMQQRKQSEMISERVKEAVRWGAEKKRF